jgi:hypothetical protein
MKQKIGAYWYEIISTSEWRYACIELLQAFEGLTKRQQQQIHKLPAIKEDTQLIQKAKSLGTVALELD